MLSRGFSVFDKRAALVILLLGATFALVSRKSPQNKFHFKIRDGSGRDLPSLFSARAVHRRWAHGHMPTYRSSRCGSSGGVAGRILNALDPSTIAHAQDQCPWGPFCYACPSEGNDYTGIDLDGGPCGSGTCSGLTSAYVYVESDPDSDRGYAFTGLRTCHNNNSYCNCSLNYCYDCDGEGGEVRGALFR